MTAAGSRSGAVEIRPEAHTNSRRLTDQSFPLLANENYPEGSLAPALSYSNSGLSRYPFGAKSFQYYRILLMK
jgi:hypothetical protein